MSNRIEDHSDAVMRCLAGAREVSPNRWMLPTTKAAGTHERAFRALSGFSRSLGGLGCFACGTGQGYSEILYFSDVRS